MQGFTHAQGPLRVVFGRGDRSRAGEEVARLGCERALVLSTPGRAATAEEVRGHLGGRAVATFDGARRHTPVEVTETALEVLRDARADCVVAVGGGSTTGLGKALAARTGVAQVVIPTTYAGSEVTEVLGETIGGVKTTRRGPEILPEVVIYDPELTDSLPVSLSVTSGLNAMAHASEGVYAGDSTPLTTLIALEGLRALRDALTGLTGVQGTGEHAREDAHRDARDHALYGAWLCGLVLGGVSMSIHHKLCHTLGAALDLPHAETHAVLLPHTTAFVEQALPEALAPVGALFGGSAGAGLHTFAASLGAPTRLADLGVDDGDLDDVATLATANPYWSPRPFTRDDVRALLQRAWEGVL
ncbi:maleylacetate reductase [Quadrisphaera granulorum]|uniref:Maleylacetate reductase n=1 Tax=Quadrisphaera granulorum TaxID=317664 RepID=A0A316A4S4_9ACTN|nr:maleylacetate reductase [Quadrisphaera granulorum]PWJ52901.1 maleylacetate reductase [Quadrisphaera granulorum]SZE97283.1 maleylacetate reductase [Quadrisphaera granulorum]